MHRWAPASGIVFVALMVVGFIVGGGGPGDSDEEILSYYADGGNRAREFVGVALVAIAVLFFLWFASVLRDRLRAIEGEPGRHSALAFGAAVASATLLVVAICVGVSTSITVEDKGDVFQNLDPNVALVIGNASYLLFVGSTMVASVLAAATAAVTHSSAVLPRWLGWLSAAVAVVLVLAILFVPIFVFWAWVLVVSAVLLMRPEPTQPERGMSSAPSQT